MQYILLIYGEEHDYSKMSEADQQQEFGLWMEYTQGIVKSGHYRGGEALQPSATATTLGMKNGKLVTTDGPFAETKEQLGGYYVIEAKDLDEAVQIASRIPSVPRGGRIEVRPIMPTPKAE